MNGIFPSAHSMDTSFYALRDGKLVEFYTGEPGVLPEGYPTIEDIDSELSNIVYECKNIPEIKTRITKLAKEEGWTKEEVIKNIPARVLADYMYVYVSQITGSDVNSFFEGLIDIYGNVLQYCVSDEPKKEMPKKLADAVAEMTFLPKIFEDCIIFYEHERCWRYTVDPDCSFIEEILEQLIIDTHTEAKLWDLLLSNFKKEPYAYQLVMLNKKKLTPTQKSMLVLSNPEFISVLKKDKNIIILDCDEAEKLCLSTNEVFKHSGGVLYIDDVDKLSPVLREFYHSQLKKYK